MRSTTSTTSKSGDVTDQISSCSADFAPGASTAVHAFSTSDLSRTMAVLGICAVRTGLNSRSPDAVIVPTSKRMYWTPAVNRRWIESRDDGSNVTNSSGAAFGATTSVSRQRPANDAGTGLVWAAATNANPRKMAVSRNMGSAEVSHTNDLGIRFRVNGNPSFHFWASGSYIHCQHSVGAIRIGNYSFHFHENDSRGPLAVRLITILVVAVLSVGGPGRQASTLPASLSDREFWSLTEQISEPDAYFRSNSGSPDNLLSNENEISTIAAALA